jgi:BNR repeat-like domain
MKKNYSSITARAILGTVLLIVGVGLILFAFSAARLRAAAPASGTIASPAGSPLAWVGTAAGTGAANGEGTCVEGISCDTFTLTVGGTPDDWAAAAKRIEVTTTAPSGADDYDLVIHQGDNNGPIVDSSGAGAGITQDEVEIAHINPATDGVGTFTVHVIYFSTVPGDQYQGAASVVPATPPNLPPSAPTDNGPKIGYENFEVPGVLTPVTVTTGPTVEYMGRGAGEPSIGVNWNSPPPNDVTGVTNFQSDLETLFVTFTNSCATGGPTATWVNRPAPTSVVIDSDPIGFTDRQTGRTFAAELTATSPTCKISYTDSDGLSTVTDPSGWVASPGTLGSGIDHETIGGGPYNNSATPPPPPHPAYANAVYYCSQDLVAAFCLRSDDGGATWGPPVDIYTSECGGLHGHVKVSPTDGTVYVPNNDCGGDGAVVVSEDNGITWRVRHVQSGTVDSIAGASDPAVGIDNNGRVYFVMADANVTAIVATSDDHGNTWQNMFDLGAIYGLKNVRYPAAVAGDGGRAAVAFYGSTAPGSANSGNFNGLWHLYVAHTFDGGLHWTTSDVTPGAPMQRGCIWTGGGANICRNLLDFFDVTIDKQGRVEVGYVNGCPGGNCAQSAATATGNAYSATATIARQSSGRRLLTAFDPASSTSAPGMPSITQRRVGSVVHLAWSEADTGNSPITSYQISRGTVTNGETLLATVPGTQTSYSDRTATDPSKTYYYKVQATNSVGHSCANNEIAAPFVGDNCSGMIIHQNLPSHPESVAVQNGANPQLAIDYVSVAEPLGTSNLLFTMKVSNLNPSSLPPNSRWRIVWDSFSSRGQQWYVGMTTDANSAATFEYGTIATAVVGLVVGVPTETMLGTLPGSSFDANGTITLVVPKAAVGNPRPGDLLGAVNGRTFNTGDTPPETLERSTQLIDHTFVKGQTDNAFPAATYMVVGNGFCNGGIGPITAVSRKTHGTAGTFDVNLPLTGTPGIECRIGQGGHSNEHQVVFTFAAPVTFSSITATPGAGGTASVASTSVAGSQVTVNLTNVTNAQTLTINLNGLSDGADTGNISWPMGVLLGDVNASGRTDNGDAIVVRNLSGTVPNDTNSARADVNCSGRVDNGDAIVIRNNSGQALPP